MDDDVAGQIVAVIGDEQQQFDDQSQLQISSEERGIETYDNVDDSAGNEIKHSIDDNPRDSSAGKLFVGGIAWETSEDSFNNYFSNYGEISDSVIMMDKLTGRPRGFGFVTFADPAVADKVLEEEHIIDGRAVEVKRTVPREDMQGKGVLKTKKIFVGGIPVSLTEDDLKEYFSSYGDVVEHQIMLDHKTGRSRGFGFVTFMNEDAVENIFSDGQIHELGGKQVEIKRAEPKRGGGDYGNDSRLRHGGGGSSKSFGGFGRGAGGYGGGYGGRMGRGYGGGRGGGQGSYSDYGDYSGYGSYGGNYGGGSAGFYAGYGGYGYGFGFGGPMYGGAGYGGSNYGTPGDYGAAAGYGGGKGYGTGGGGGYGGKGYGGGGGGGYGSGGGGYDGGKGYGNGGAASGGRYHPYRKQ